METYLKSLFCALRPYEQTLISLRADDMETIGLLDFEGGYLQSISAANTIAEREELASRFPEIKKLTKSNSKAEKCVFMVIKGVEKINLKIPSCCLKSVRIPILIEQADNPHLTIKNFNNDLIFKTAEANLQSSASVRRVRFA